MAKKPTTRLNFTSDFYKLPKTKAGVLADYDKMRRLANDRLRAIENAKTTKDGLENVLQYAYKRATHDLNGLTRFPSAKAIEELGYNSIVGRLNAMRRFLMSESSTVRGVQNIYKRNAEAFNKNWKTNLTTTQLAKFFNKDTGLYEKLKNAGYGSETIMLAIAEIQADREEILDKIRETDKQHQVVSKDPLVQAAIDTAVGEYGDEVVELFDGTE